MTNRVAHIDIAKGMSIILIALFHSKLRSFAPDVIDSMSLFRLPLFLFLSGVFFSASDDIYSFLRKKSGVLLKPYFVTSLALFIIAVLLREENLAWQLKGLLYGNGDVIRWAPMWFLPHLFSVYVFAYFVFKFTNIQEQETSYQYIFIILMAAIGIHWIDAFWHLKLTLWGDKITLPGLPFSIDLVLVSSTFFIAGAFLRKSVIDFSPSLYLLPMSIVVFIAISIFTDSYLNLNKRAYLNPFIASTGAACGIYFMICVSYYVNKANILRRELLILGRGSLFILIFHSFIGTQAYNYFNGFGTYELELWFAVLAFLLSIWIPVLIRIVVLKSRLLSFVFLPVKAWKLHDQKFTK